ncbi:proton/glutamate symporter [Psychrosphaera saromensis]|uniref:Dicarboxylate/amino acid:cation symporter n=1 Tax=Psychrosphaera saromensis TaxID=716813 RepID=A0A2S7UX41_9GAMM|nr:dicarboxylate/amino acid:cation symporter [Psychrosphaera saromensis]PQJ54072.1 dicarboxylate/amino acid:cation symporter [Psychrosphaera saromensis]GHB76611.1 proton/glutamate symporter [Psychrosphaera saromensis]GLQ14430.1 proton/glutamate symporter [Psychrosphaera saromensis]
MTKQASKQKFGLTARILIGMFAGIFTGVTLQTLFGTSGDFVIPLGITNLSINDFFVNGLFHVGGSIFIASLKMIVVPLVFVSLVVGTCSLNDTSKLARLGGKSIGLYLMTTAIAITLAILFALLIGPGEGLNLSTDQAYAAKEAPGFAQVLINMFPTNPINSMAEGNMLQVIVFALLFGVSMALAGKAGERLASLFNDLNTVIMRLVVILMNVAPYGVFFLLAKLFTTLEFETIASLIKYFLLVVFVLLLHAFVVYGSLLKVFTGLSPVMFFRKMRDAALFAFSTSSSGATLPVTMETATKKLGVKNSIASFTLPMGATLNMDGTAIMQGVATVFIAQVFAVDLALGDYLMVVLTATLASIGTAAVPGVGLIMLAMVLQQVGLPVEGIALIIGVDRLLDMTRTAVNVTGDCMVSCVVATSEKEFDYDVFADKDAGKNIENVDFEHLKN